MCGTYVPHISHSCTLYMGNVWIGGAFEVSTTGIQALIKLYTSMLSWSECTTNSNSKLMIDHVPTTNT